MLAHKPASEHLATHALHTRRWIPNYEMHTYAATSSCRATSLLNTFAQPSTETNAQEAIADTTYFESTSRKQGVRRQTRGNDASPAAGATRDGGSNDEQSAISA